MNIKNNTLHHFWQFDQYAILKVFSATKFVFDAILEPALKALELFSLDYSIVIPANSGIQNR